MTDQQPLVATATDSQEIEPTENISENLMASHTQSESITDASQVAAPPTQNEVDSVPTPIKRKRKRPKSAYMWFTAEKRQEVKLAHPDKGIGGIATVIGSMWRGLTEEQKKPYVDMAATDKERFAREEAEGNYLEEEPKKSDRPEVPIARIKKIMTADPAVNKIQKQAVTATASATKQFIARLAQCAAHSANLHSRRLIRFEDVVTAIYRNPEFEFLRLDFKRGDGVPPKKNQTEITTWRHDQAGESVSGKPQKLSVKQQRLQASAVRKFDAHRI